MRSARAVAPVLAILAVLAGSSVAIAQQGSEEPTPRQVDLALGTDAVLQDDGRQEDLYRIPVPGEDIYTHGPDTVGAIESAGQDLDEGDPERAPVCATDYFQQVLYVRLATAPDRYSSQRPRIHKAMRQINHLLNREAQESGNVSADYKVKCAGGQIAVDNVVLPAGTGNDYGSVVTALKQKGLGDNERNADYTIFFDDEGKGTGACGVGAFYNDERLSESNNNNNPDNVGPGYGLSYNDCWFNGTPMHENGHNQGAVGRNAPDSTGSGSHCNDENDVLCYAPDGGDRNQSEVERCTDRLHFDCDHDSYFDAAPESGEYLARNWNLGSSLNRFIRFGSGASTPTDEVAASSVQATEGAVVSGDADSLESNDDDLLVVDLRGQAGAPAQPGAETQPDEPPVAPEPGTQPTDPPDPDDSGDSDGSDDSGDESGEGSDEPGDSDDEPGDGSDESDDSDDESGEGSDDSANGDADSGQSVQPSGESPTSVLRATMSSLATLWPKVVPILDGADLILSEFETGPGTVAAAPATGASAGDLKAKKSKKGKKKKGKKNKDGDSGAGNQSTARPFVGFVAAYDDVPNDLTSFELRFRGQALGSCFQSLYNFESGSYEVIDAREVGVNEQEFAVDPANDLKGEPGDYVSGQDGSGTLVVNVRCSGIRMAVDQLQLTVGAP